MKVHAVTSEGAFEDSIKAHLLAKYVADQLALRGTIDALRGATKMNGVEGRGGGRYLAR